MYNNQNTFRVMSEISDFLYDQGRKASSQVVEDEKRIQEELDALDDPNHDDNGYDQIAQEK